MAVGTKSYNATFNETKNFMVSGDRRMTDLTGLTPGTMYEITAYAVNGAGMGQTAVTRGTTLNGRAIFHKVSPHVYTSFSHNLDLYI